MTTFFKRFYYMDFGDSKRFSLRMIRGLNKLLKELGIKFKKHEKNYIIKRKDLLANPIIKEYVNKLKEEGMLNGSY